MAVNINITPNVPSITVTDNASVLIPSLSGYTTSNQLTESHSSLELNILNLSGMALIDGYHSNVSDSSSSSSSNLEFWTGVSARLYLDTYNNTNVYGSSYRGRRFRGTPSNPSGILLGDVLLQLVGDGYYGDEHVPEGEA